MLQLSVPEVNLSWLNSRTTQVLAAATATFLVFRYVTKKRYKLPPGPRPLPLLGNILAFRKKNVPDVLEEWHSTYGPVVRFYAGPMCIIMINETNELTEAFVKQGSDFSGRPFIYSFDLFSEGSKDIVFANYGDTWKYQRKIAVQALRQYLTGRQLEQRVHEALTSIIEAMINEQKNFDPHRIISLCVFNVIHGLCFGTTFQLDNPLFLHLLSIFDGVNDQVGNGFLEDFFPPLRWWPTKKFTEIKAMFDEFNNYVYEKYAELKTNFDENDVKTLTDNIVLAQKQAVEENSIHASMMTDTHAGQIMADCFGAGVDTTRLTLDWTIYVLASRPDIQAKVHEELDEVVGDSIPGKEHRARLVYLEAVMLEAMRLFPVAPLGVPHNTLRDSKIGDYDIPANTLILANHLQIHHSDKNWDDPLAFNPERFFSANGDHIVLRNPSFVPFSVGHRSCLGESLARLEMLYILAGLLQKLSFTIDPTTQFGLVSNSDGFTNRARPYKVKVTCR